MSRYLLADESGVLETLFPFFSDQDRLLRLLIKVRCLPLRLGMVNELLQVAWVYGVHDIHEPLPVQLLGFVPFVRQIFAELLVLAQLLREVFDRELLQLGHDDVAHLLHVEELLLAGENLLVEVPIQVIVLGQEVLD